jgi:Tfp pilus assembly protein PilZ
MANDIPFRLSKSGRDQLTRSMCAIAYECRNGIRMPYHTAVELNSSAGLVKGMIRNISAGGLFVDTKTVVSVGHKFELRFRFRSGNHSMKLPVQVVRVTIKGIGLKLI